MLVLSLPHGLGQAVEVVAEAPGHPPQADSLRVIQEGLDRGLDAQTIARAARLVQAYELMYWDTLHQASE